MEIVVAHVVDECHVEHAVNGETVLLCQKDAVRFKHGAVDVGTRFHEHVDYAILNGLAIAQECGRWKIRWIRG